MKKKILIIFILILVSIVGFIGISRAYHREAKDIKIDGNNVSMTLGKQNMIANLISVSRESFLVNNGNMSSLNTGEFVVIPIEEVRYLEEKYSDFIHCDSPGEQEGKDSLISIGFIAANQTVEKEMKKIERSIKKESKMPVIEISGSKLENIEGLEEEVSNYGIIVISHEKPNTYYLVDSLKIIEEDYQ